MRATSTQTPSSSKQRSRGEEGGGERKRGDEKEGESRGGEERRERQESGGERRVKRLEEEAASEASQPHEEEVQRFHQ